MLHLREISVLEHIANTIPLRWCSARSTTEIEGGPLGEGIKNINIYIDLKYPKVDTQYT